MNSSSQFLLLVLTFSCTSILLTDACCPFPAFSFSAITTVTQENFKCSEPITVTCQFTVDDEEGEDDNFHVGIAGNVTNEEGSRVKVLKKGTNTVSVSLTCDTKSKLWSVNKSSKKYSNVGCVMSNSGSVWIVY